MEKRKIIVISILLITIVFCGVFFPTYFILKNDSTETSTTATTSSTTTTTKFAPISPSDVSILVIVEPINESHLFSGDGRSKMSANIYAASPSYTRNAVFALIQDRVHIFGGVSSSDTRKIGRLDGCRFTTLSARLNFEGGSSAAALAIENNSKALVCFEFVNTFFYHNSCDIFDGENITATFKTRYSHYGGSLGFYENQPTTVGSWKSDGRRAVETLTKSGWELLRDHPDPIDSHNLIGLPSGDMLMIGGVYRGYVDGYRKDVWRLQKNRWDKMQDLHRPYASGSVINIGSSIFAFAGSDYSELTPIQRIDLNEDEKIVNIEDIGSYSKRYYLPVLYHATDNRCT